MMDVPTFAALPVSSFLDALASADPTPGGGTAAAMAGAMGTSLLIMVTGLAKSKSNTGEEKAALAGARAALGPVRDALVALADADTRAFDAVMAAYRLPKATDQDKAARTAAVQAALQGATVVPLDTLRACAEALRQAVVVAQCGNRAAASDAGVALELLGAAAAGAEANVRINLGSLRDEAFTAATAADMAHLLSAVAAARAAALTALT
jgi:methenyltetrahydrofolate cyclohydrolase